MLYAFFTSCLISTSTGDVECTSTYTEMASVSHSMDECKTQAGKLQRGAIDSVLLANPELIVSTARYGCGTYTQVKRQAEATHLSYKANGIPSLLFEF